ncbi:hypothetical protein jhhlp_000485 [Lomentospora prolificans]|uniref:Major facilitator superfamily (MFS) profile domain-containing protein n=1 Tax=Lomentospora prolificans TaxID=41688 RepID=A0A2N3NL28_9PEZI|nr:hypothetical protein jhhlp_000485 [Lomentospora prolificans]
MDEPQPTPVLRQDSEGAVRRRRRWQWWNRDVHDEVSYLTTVNYSVKERETQILRLVDDNGFNFKVFFVAASGFLASSYSLFSTNVVTPAVNYIYPACGRLGKDSGSVIDLLTLVGTIIGMLTVGHLADRAGRKRLYGFELCILIIATIGMVQAGEGFMYQLDDGIKYEGSMNMYAWIAWWRTTLGYGIGAEATEWASTESRGTMLAAVKSMQSLARILAASVGLGFLREMTRHRKIDFQQPLITPLEINQSKIVVDSVWRWVIGIAVVPAAIAILARLTIPETPRYYVDIMKDLRKAVKNAIQVYRTKKVQETNPLAASPTRRNSDQNDHWYKGAWAYLNQDSRRALFRLVSITLLWGLMDVGFYGLSLDSPNVLSSLVNEPRRGAEEASSDQGCPDAMNWRATSEPPDTTIYHMLELNSQRSLTVVSIASILGNFAAILLVNRFERRKILVVTFFISAILFAITGATLLDADNKGQKPTASLVFYAITHFVYNAGPNTLIFVLAAEIFPTVYRGTFYGIAAAGGKIGAIIIRTIIWSKGNSPHALGVRLLVCMPLMFIAAGISWYLPAVQYTHKKADIEHGQGRSPPTTREKSTPIHTLLVPAQPPQGPGRAEQQHGAANDAASDAASTISTDTTPSRCERRRKKGSGLFSSLQNMTLEAIAPNPNLRDRRQRKGSSTPLGIISPGQVPAQPQLTPQVSGALRM